MSPLLLSKDIAISLSRSGNIFPLMKTYTCDSSLADARAVVVVFPLRGFIAEASSGVGGLYAEFALNSGGREGAGRRGREHGGSRLVLPSVISVSPRGTDDRTLHWYAGATAQTLEHGTCEVYSVVARSSADIRRDPSPSIKYGYRGGEVSIMIITNGLVCAQWSIW